MRTTALVGSFVLASSAASVAQTTVTGNLDISYRAVQDKKNPGNSYRGFGKETQIDIQNKGSLNNGLGYAAGFSLEFDGNDNGKNATSGWATENTYIDFISGNTTVSLSIDHMQNPDSHAHVNMVGVGYIGGQGIGGPIVSGANGKIMSSIYPDNALSQYQSWGAGVTQKTGIGSFSFNYVPSATWTGTNFSGATTTAYYTASSNGVGAPDIGNNASVGNADGTGKAAYEVGFKGDLGVKGLNVLAFYNKSDSIDANGPNGKNFVGKTLGGNYNFGQFTVGLDWRRTYAAEQTAALNDGKELINTGKSVGVAYAINPQWSLGAVYAKADLSGNAVAAGTNNDTEKTKIISIGYNMGPVVVNAQGRDTKNLGGSGTINGDAKDAIIKVSTKF